MRVFAISDLHVDYKENRRWVQRLSNCDFTDDVVIVAGDITDRADADARYPVRTEAKICTRFFCTGQSRFVGEAQ